jgi:hypothetical protein
VRFAGARELEPGDWFRAYAGGEPNQWWGVEPVVSRFAGKHRVRVLCTPGPSFVTDVDVKFHVIDWTGGRG